MRDSAMSPPANGYGERYDPERDRGARVVAFLSPYFFWGMVGAIAGGVYLLAGL